MERKKKEKRKREKVRFLMNVVQVHVLPKEMLGRSTFGLSMELLKWLPVRIVDQFLLLMSRFILGNTAQLGLKRPKLGPLEFKAISGKTPVLDVGTISKIRAGKIKVNSLYTHSSCTYDFFNFSTSEKHEYSWSIYLYIYIKHVHTYIDSNGNVTFFCFLLVIIIFLLWKYAGGPGNKETNA